MATLAHADDLSGRFVPASIGAVGFVDTPGELRYAHGGATGGTDGSAGFLARIDNPRPRDAGRFIL